MRILVVNAGSSSLKLSLLDDGGTAAEESLPVSRGQFEPVSELLGRVPPRLVVCHLGSGGGVGEHATEIRAGAANGLGFLGLAVDEDRNAGADGDTDITAPGAAVRTFVVAAREDLEIARQVREVLER